MKEIKLPPYIVPYENRKKFCRKVRDTEKEILSLKSEGKWKEAAHLEEGGLQYRYVYAVGLHDLGRIDEAIEVLKAALEYSKYSAEVLYALSAYSFEIARYADARTYAKQLVSLYPDNVAYLQLNRQIRTLVQEEY